MSCVRVLMAGTGNALHPYRSQASVLIDDGSTPFLVDSGCFAPNILARGGLKPYEVDHVIVTHGHTDHYCSLPQLVFLKTFAQRGPRITVYTVPESLDLMRQAVLSASGAREVRASYVMLRPGDSVSIGDATIRAFEARHSVPSLSLAITTGGNKIVVSGDTAPTNRFREEAKGSTLAIHEASLASREETSIEAKWHSTVSAAIEQVSGAEIGVFYHLSIDSEKEAKETVVMNRKGAKSNLIVPEDGTTIKIC